MYPTLETERLTLRPWEIRDAERLMDFAPVLNETIPDDELPQINSLADAEWVVNDNIKDDNQWAIVYKPDNIMVGWFGITGANKDCEKREIRIWLDGAYRNKGICGEALEKAVNFAFFGLKAKCLIARCFNENTAANKALLRFGFSEFVLKSCPKACYQLKAKDYQGAAFEYDFVLLKKPISVYTYENPIRKIDSIKYVKQPTGYLCGQSVIAMLAGVSVDEVINVMQNDKGTSVSEIRKALAFYGIETATKTRQKFENNPLPECCLLSIQMPGYGHRSLYYKGTYYDPEFGKLSELPKNAKLCYYWEIKN